MLHSLLHTPAVWTSRGPVRGKGEGGWVTHSDITVMSYLAEEQGVPHHHQQGAGTADGHVESLGIAHKA